MNNIDNEINIDDEIFDLEEITVLGDIFSQIYDLPSLVDVLPEELKSISDEKYKAKYNLIRTIFVLPLLKELESYEKSVNPQGIRSVYNLGEHSIKAQVRLLARYLKAYGISIDGLIPTTSEEVDNRIKELCQNVNDGPKR